MTPAVQGMPIGSGDRAASVTFRLLWVGLLLFVSSGPTAAQRSKPEGPEPTPKGGALPPGLEGIPGLRPGMTEEEMIEVAMGAVTTGRLQEGRRILLAVVKKNPANLEALSDLGFVYERLAEEARSDTSDPDREEKIRHFIDQAVDVYTEAASLALAADKLDVAEQLYTRILLYRPGRGDALLGLARVLGRSGRRLQAIGRYLDYLNTLDGRDDPVAYLEMGKLHLEDGRWRQALEALKRAQKLDPNDPRIDAALALAYRRGERMDEALEAARQATQKAPQNAEFRDILARLELVQGSGEQAAIEARRAIEFTRRALVEHPRDKKLLDALGRYYETYEKSLRTLLTEGKANPVVRVDLARAVQEHAEVGRTLALIKALEVLTKATAGEREDTRLLEELASVQAALSLDKAAAATCRKLLAAEPTNAAARRILKQIEARGETKGG